MTELSLKIHQQKEKLHQMFEKINTEAAPSPCQELFNTRTGQSSEKKMSLSPGVCTAMPKECNVQLTPDLFWKIGNRCFLTCFLEEGRKSLSQGAVEHRNTQRDCSIPTPRKSPSFTKLSLGTHHLIAVKSAFRRGWTR